jgi:hypothetical protein
MGEAGPAVPPGRFPASASFSIVPVQPVTTSVAAMLIRLVQMNMALTSSKRLWHLGFATGSRSELS